MARRTPARKALAHAVGFSLLATTGCASAPLFQRPAAAGKPTITDAATGRTFDDCRQAFAQAASETVLLFSEGVFRCGPEVAAASEWLVLQGAGMGRTVLEAGEGSGELKLSAIRPGRFLRVADLSFGGLTEQPGDDAKAELVRVAVTTDRPALFGDRDRGVTGSVLAVHSLLVGRPSAQAPRHPTPVAFNGNERVGLLESVLVDVEQEFERFPAPGTQVLLSEGVEASFELHEPAQKLRRQKSSRTNTPCGNGKNPAVLCASQGQSPSEDSAVAEAARRVQAGKPLARIAEALQEASSGFAERFHAQLGSAIRQPDVFWFDEPSAQLLEQAAGVQGPLRVGLYARSHAEELAQACGRSDVPTKSAMDRARALDRLLPEPQVAQACAKALEPRTQALLQECAEGWEWDRALAQIAQADLALGDGSTQGKACREQLQTRLSGLLQKGGLAKSYLLQVNRQLELNAPAGGAEARLSLDGVVAALPWVVTKTGRTLPQPAQPSVLDRIVKAAQAPNSGDGRKLVEVTGPCQLVPTQPGSPQMKALGRLALAEERAGGASDEPDVKLELPVEVTKSDLDASTPAGGVNMALIKKCDEKLAQAYPVAIGRYVGEELERLAQGGGQAALDAEVVLHLVKGSATAQELKVRPRQLPVVRPALAKLAEELNRGTSSLAVGGAQAPVVQAASSSLQDSANKKPPTWGMADLARAADLLSRAGMVDTDSCAFLLPQVPWQQVEGALNGPIVLEEIPATLRCRPDARGFELAVWVDGEPGQRIRILSALERALTARLGQPLAQKTASGPAAAWPFTPKSRTGFVYKALPPATSMLGYILVPLGSNWTQK